MVANVKQICNESNNLTGTEERNASEQINNAFRNEQIRRNIGVIWELDDSFENLEINGNRRNYNEDI